MVLPGDGTERFDPCLYRVVYVKDQQLEFVFIVDADWFFECPVLR